MKPKESIIIPVYNGEKTVRECLESVLTQSLREIEVLCLNDGSTDGTAGILREIAAGDGRVRLYGFEENRGIVLALKMGLLEANGEYVMFVDSDDILLPGACENAVRLIEEYDADILQFAIRVKHQKGANIDAFMKSLQCRPMESSGEKILYDCFCMHRFPHNVYTKIYRGNICRTAAESMPDIELKQFTDLYITFFLLYYAKTFRSVVEGPYYEYRFLGAGVFSSPPTARQFEQMCSNCEILPLIEEFLRDRHEYAARQFLVGLHRHRIEMRSAGQIDGAAGNHRGHDSSGGGTLGERINLRFYQGNRAAQCAERKPVRHGNKTGRRKPEASQQQNNDNKHIKGR